MTLYGWGVLETYTDFKAADAVCLYTQAKFGSKELNIKYLETSF
jgi:hypothetical protein